MSMGGRVLYCNNCKKETAFGYYICDECGGLYYNCEDCKMEKKKVPENEIYTDRKPCNFH